tara:strand:+ start:1180 stop:1425 length:246 start_codon:yes stop_codon:yes gene_type:complete
MTFDTKDEQELIDGFVDQLIYMRPTINDGEDWGMLRRVMIYSAVKLSMFSNDLSAMIVQQIKVAGIMQMMIQARGIDWYDD